MSNRVRKMKLKTASLMCVCAVLLASITGSVKHTEVYEAVAAPIEHEQCAHAEQRLLDLAEATGALDVTNLLGDDYITLDDPAQAPTSSATTKYYPVNNGNSLTQVARTLRKQKFESIAGFTYYGKKSFNYTNYLPSKVLATKSHRADFLASNGTLAVHNHPSCAPFSSGDLYAEALFNTPIVMVVTDLYTYTLQPLKNGWGDPATLKAVYDDHLKDWKDWADDYLKNYYHYSPSELLSKPLPPDDGSLEWFCDSEILRGLKAGKKPGKISIRIGLWYMDQAMRNMADYFGLLYTRELTDEFNFANKGVFKPVITTRARTTSAVKSKTFGDEYYEYYEYC